MTPDDGRWIGYGVTALAVAIGLAFRVRSMRKTQPLKLERLWIVPAIYAAFASCMFWYLPPQGWQWSWAAGALLLGAGVGWLRGKAMRIAVDPVTHALNQRQSPAALLIIVGLVAVRLVTRSVFDMDGGLQLASHGLVDAFIAFAVGLLAFQRLEMFIRARRLLAMRAA